MVLGRTKHTNHKLSKPISPDTETTHMASNNDCRWSIFCQFAKYTTKTSWQSITPYHFGWWEWSPRRVKPDVLQIASCLLKGRGRLSMRSIATVSIIDSSIFGSICLDRFRRLLWFCVVLLSVPGSLAESLSSHLSQFSVHSVCSLTLKRTVTLLGSWIAANRQL